MKLYRVFVRPRAALVGIAMRDFTAATVSAGSDTVTAKSICLLLRVIEVTGVRRAFLTFSTIGVCVFAGVVAGSTSLGFPVYLLLAAIAGLSSFSTP